MTMFPNLIIAGVPKAGTSSLYNWLNAHPQVHGSYEKETCFFADPDSHTFNAKFNVLQGIETYASAFPTPEPATSVQFEATPTYIYSATALARVPKLASNPKCLFVVRDPASQIQSVYRYFRDNWNHIPADMTFEGYLAAVRAGDRDFSGNELAARALGYADYRPWLLAWREALGRERMKVVTFDQLCSDPRSMMDELAEWVGIDPRFYDNFSFATENETYAPKNRFVQQINIALRGYLPKGRVYEVGRRLYRRLNTTVPVKSGEDALLGALRREFAPSTALLEQEFGLDLSRWKP